MTSTLTSRPEADAPTEPIVIPPALLMPRAERPERVVVISRSALVTSLVSTLVIGAAALVAFLPAGAPVADVELFGSNGRPRVTGDGPPTGPTRGPNDPAPTKVRKAKPGKTASKPTGEPLRSAEPGPQENDPAPDRKPASEAPAPADAPSGRPDVRPASGPASGSAVTPDVRPAGPAPGPVLRRCPGTTLDLPVGRQCPEPADSPDAPAVPSGASTPAPSALASISPEDSSASPATN